jgi:hypothetical protein
MGDSGGRTVSRSQAVAKRKDSLALYEVIGRSRQARAEAGLAIPGWMGRQRSGPMRPQAPAQPAAEAEDMATLQPIAAPAEREVWAGPGVSVSAGRLRLSLNYVTCVIAGVALVLLFVAMFILGRTSARHSQAAKTEAGAGIQASARGEATGDKTPSAAGPGTVREKGKYYLVVQGMGGKGADLLAEARSIERFCNAKGEQVNVYEYTKEPRQYIVLSAQGFDAPDSPEALRYVSAIETLGKNYKAQGGKYEFKQRDAAGRVRPWFLQWKQ